MSITITTVERIGEVAANPAPVANSGFLYTKDVAGVTQLFYEDDAGSVTQLTPSAAPGDTPWLRTGTSVALDQTGDTDVVPFDDGSTTIGTAAKRWLTLISASNGLWVYDAASDANRSAVYSNGGFGIRWGAGGASALDVGLQRTLAKEISVTSGDGGGSGGLMPFTDNSADGKIGKSTLRWGSVTASAHQVFAASGAANTTAALTSGRLRFGLGGANALDVSLSRTGAATPTLYVDDDNDVGIRVVPPDGDGYIGYVDAGTSARWARISANEHNVYAAGVGANPTAKLSAAAAEFGPGGATALDVGIKRSAAGVIAVTNAGAGSGSVIPNADNSGTLGTAASRWASVNVSGAAAANGVAVYAASGDANPTVHLGGSGAGYIEVGPGGAVAPTVKIVWSATGVAALQNGAGSASLIPFADTQGSLGTTGGASGRIFASAAATSLAAYNAGTDTQPKVQISYTASGGIVRMGAGTATAPDTAIARTAAAEITIDDNAGGDCNVIPATDHASNVGASLGLGNRRWAQVNAFEVNTGDIVFTDPGCVICGRQFEEGDDLVMRVIKTHDGPQGRRTRTVPAHYGCR